MGKRGPIPKIELHPDREAIDKAIVALEPQIHIAKRYKITPSVLNAYIRNGFARAVVRADMERESAHGTIVLREMLTALETLERMRESLLEYLEDPERPGKLWFGPRADEIEVVYDAPRRNDAGVFRERTKLQTLLEEIRDHHPEFEMVEINVKTADNRKLLLSVLDSTVRQLALWVSTEVAASQLRTDEAVQDILNEFIPVMLEEADGNPDLRRHVAKVLKRVKQRLVGFD